MLNSGELKLSSIYSIPQLLDRGIILLDKPPRISSHEASAFVRKILEIRRTGHSGTLDPDVSGVLVVALNRATRFLEFLKNMDKEYVCLMRLYGKPGEQELRSVLKGFVGTIEQQVPELAAVRRKKRKREVKSLDVLQIRRNSMTTDVLFLSRVQKGTYIRVLCEDIGKSLGMRGKMLELRRTSVGQFSERNQSLCTLQQLWRAWLLWKQSGSDKELRSLVMPLEQFNPFPAAVLKDEHIQKACHGAILYRDNFSAIPELASSTMFSVLDSEGRLVCVAKTIRDLNDSAKLAVPKKVFYPGSP